MTMYDTNITAKSKNKNKNKKDKSKFSLQKY